MAVLLYAVSGTTRAGATRSAYVSPTRQALAGLPVFTINSVDRSHYCDRDTIEILDDLNELPNTLSFECFGFTPANNQIVRLTVGATKEFEGRITNIAEYHDRLNSRTVYRVSCTDYTYDFDALLVTKAYGSQSGTSTASDIVTNFSSGFTQTHIASSLPTVSAIQFKMKKPSSALRQLCDAIGGDCYVDYDKDVHVFLTETDVAPDTISSTTKNWRAFRYRSMIERVANRIIVEGMGSAATTTAGAGATSLRVDEATVFVTAGGTVTTGNQIITYTGKGLGDPALALWTSRTPSSATASWRDVIWADTLGLFVAVGDSVMTSPDGIVWTSRTPAEANTWTGVTWASSLGLLVAVSQGGTHQVMTSPDGITWTARTAAASKTWRSVVWASSLALFVAVASDPAVMSSSDGITWTSRTPSTAAGVLSITWAPSLGLFVAVANNLTAADQVMTSSNGTAWTTRTAASTNPWVDVTWSPTLALFVAVSTAGTNGVMTSPDGITWTSHDAPTTLHAAVAWSAEMAVFVSVGGSGVMSSSDGSTWTSGIMPTSGSLSAVVWSPTAERFVAVGAPASGLSVMTLGFLTLTGIPASGAGAIVNAIAEGDEINLLAQRDDATSQATYGIRQAYVQDRRLSIASAQARGDAELLLRKDPYIEGTFITTDSKVRSGRRVTISMASAWGISGTFTISKVRVSWDIDKARVQREVTFSSNSGDNDLYRILRRLQDAA